MIRALPGWALFLGVAGLILALLASGLSGLGAGGQGPLDGHAILAADGAKPFADFLTVFPPLPFLLTAGVAVLGGGLWESAPVSPTMIAAALAGGVLAIAWFHSLREAYGGWAGPLLLLLLCLGNPLFLMAVRAGPEAPLVLLGVWMLAVGLFELRRQAVAGDAIIIGLGLVLIGFSSPYGLTLAIASLPFLLIAAPAELLQRSAFGLLLALVFPFVASVLSFALVAWIFTGQGWTVLAASLDQSAAGAVETVWAALAYVLIAVLGTAPILVALAIRGGQRVQLLMPTIAMIGILVCGFLMARSFGVVPDPALGLAPALSLAVVAAARWPRGDRRRLWIAALLLALGAGGALVGMAVTRDAAPSAASADQAADLALGRFLRGKSDVLIDTEAAPAVVGARGGADGLVGPADETFTLSLLARRPVAAYVAVREGERDHSDRISRGLPKAYDGLKNYNLIYDRDGWRVYQRQTLAEPCRSPLCAS